jgi:alpha-1,2-mannosyltransferase
MLTIDDTRMLKPHPAVLIALALWGGLTAAVTIKTLVSPEQHTVYPKLAARAIAWWSGRDLYAEYKDLGVFPYSPTFAIALTPFAVLGDRAGAVLWSWVSIAVYVWGLRRLARDVLPGSWPPTREALLLMLAMIGAIRGLWNAQSNALIIGLLMLGASAVARRRWWEAACLLGGPVFIKLWAVAIALLVAALMPRKLVPRIAAVLVIGAALPLLTQPWGVVANQYLAWFTLLASMSEDVTGNHRDSWTLLRTASVGVPSTLYRIIQVAAAGAALAWCLWLQHRRMPPRRLLAIALSAGAAWMMGVGPGVEYNTYVTLAPMVSWAVLESFELRRGQALAATAFLMTMLLGAGAVERILLRLSSAAPAMLPAGTLVFVVWLVAVAASTDRVTTEPSLYRGPSGSDPLA